MDYEILNSTSMYNSTVNGACADVNIPCPSINFCADVNLICGGGGNDGGNVFPCANPGLGCRHGCGGGYGNMCVAPVSQQ